MLQVSQKFLRKRLDVENNEVQRVNFALHKDCNLNCEYCYQKVTFDRNKLSDKEIFSNFEYCFNRLENLSRRKLFPQILGGEPTLWSDWLIDRVCDRVKYYECELFTNGFNRDCRFFTELNFSYLTHVVNWKNKDVNDFKPLDRETFSIVVTHKDLNFFKEWFLNCRSENLKNWDILACGHVNPDLNLSVPDIIELGEFLEDLKLENQITFGAKLLKKGLKSFQDYCSSRPGSWICDCENKTVSVCCGGLDSNHQKANINNFSPFKSPICNNCTTIGNLEM